MKSGENIEVNHQPNKDGSRVMPYSGISLETDFSNSMSQQGIRNNPSLVTFSPPSNSIKSQPLYVNFPIMQQNEANILSVPVSQTRTNTRYANGQSSHHIYNNATTN